MGLLPSRVHAGTSAMHMSALQPQQLAHGEQPAPAATTDALHTPAATHLGLARVRVRKLLLRSEHKGVEAGTLGVRLLLRQRRRLVRRQRRRAACGREWRVAAEVLVAEATGQYSCGVAGAAMAEQAVGCEGMCITCIANGHHAGQT